VSDGEKWLFRHVPFYAGWYRFLQFWNSADRMYPAFRVDPDWETPDVSISLPNEKMRRIMTAHLTAELADAPELVDQVLPDYPPLGKRILQDNGWFRALLRDNVTLINDGISRHRALGGLVVRRGVRRRHHRVARPASIPTNSSWPMDVTARGARLHDVGRGSRIPSASRCPASRTCSVCTARTRTRSSAV
jgi:4-hydroxyacetophenone monooxygenase